MPTVYVSGPMTGLPNLNFPAFHAAAHALRSAGFVVVNPAELNPDPTTPRGECLRADLRALADCDMLVLLPGWEQSAGARREVENALAMDMAVVPIDRMPLAGQHTRECMKRVLRDAMSSYEGDSRMVPAYAVAVASWLG